MVKKYTMANRPSSVPMVDNFRSQYEMFSWHPLNDEAFKATTVLTRAILCEAHWKVSYLLKKGCDPNKPAGRNVIYPLVVVCYAVNNWKRASMLKMLIEHGADPTKTDVRGRNSVMYACALALEAEAALMVRDWDYDFNVADMYGDTLLHICARAGDARVMGVVLGEILKHRLDVSIENRRDLTPLSIAILSGNYECAGMLYKAGASPRLPRLVPSDVWGMSDAISLTPRHCWDKRGPCSSTQGLGRLKEKMPKLFSRVSVGSASDLCRFHSERSRVVHRADRVQTETEALAVSNVRCPRQRNSAPPACLEGIRDISRKDKSAYRYPRDDDDDAYNTATEEEINRPASSLDFINAMLDSPAYKRRLTPSFSHPPSSIAPVDAEWIATINTYNTKVEEIPLPIAVMKLRKASPKQRMPHNLSSTSSSASSSQSQLFRSKVMKHIITPRRLSVSPSSSSTTSFSSGSSRFKVPSIKLARVPSKSSM